MMLNTHNNGKIVTRDYQRTLADAVIDRDRVGEDQYAWLDVPPSVGNGAYNNEARGWMDNPDHNGAMRRYTRWTAPATRGWSRDRPRHHPHPHRPR